jgi:hypothetical protein
MVIFRGRIHVDIMEAGPLCKQIARDSYLRNGDSRKEGACCIQRVIDAKAENQLTRKWQDILGEANDTTNADPDMLFKAQLHDQGVSKAVKVFAEGNISAPRID